MLSGRAAFTADVPGASGMASSILEARCSMTVLPSYSFARRTRVQLLFLQPGIHLGVNFEFRQAVAVGG
jgi:hypothetical protein